MSEVITTLQVALDYAACGWPVFPCAPSTKQPLTAKGFRDASVEEAKIRAWWSQNPDAMIGVPTGAASGIWVLDIDNHPESGKDGHASLAALEAEHGGLPDTVRVRTPSVGCTSTSSAAQRRFATEEP